MTRILASLALLAALTPAHAQIQPGPNLTASGRPFLYAPRAGYSLPPHAPAPLPPPLPDEPPPGELCTVDFSYPPFLNVRASPNGPVLGVLPNGAPVVVRGLVGNWADIGIGLVYRPYLYCPPPPDTAPQAAPPMSYSQSPAISLPPAPAAVPASRPPGQRAPPNLPCPDGCPREPDDVH